MELLNFIDFDSQWKTWIEDYNFQEDTSGGQCENPSKIQVILPLPKNKFQSHEKKSFENSPQLPFK